MPNQVDTAAFTRSSTGYIAAEVQERILGQPQLDEIQQQFLAEGEYERFPKPMAPQPLFFRRNGAYNPTTIMRLA